MLKGVNSLVTQKDMRMAFGVTNKRVTAAAAVHPFAPLLFPFDFHYFVAVIVHVVADELHLFFFKAIDFRQRILLNYCCPCCLLSTVRLFLLCELLGNLWILLPSFNSSPYDFPFSVFLKTITHTYPFTHNLGKDKGWKVSLITVCLLSCLLIFCFFFVVFLRLFAHIVFINFFFFFARLLQNLSEYEIFSN